MVLAVGDVTLELFLVGVLSEQGGQECPESLAVVKVSEVGQFMQHDSI